MSFFKRLIGKLTGRRTQEATHASQLESWRVLHARNDTLGQHLVVRIRIEKPSLPSGVRYDTAVLIEWAYEGNAGELPDSETTESMMNLDQALDPLTCENGFSELVCVKTGLGVRQWLFYSGDRARFMTEFNQCLANHPPFPVEILFDDDPEWTIWKEFLADIEPHMEGANRQ